MSSGSVETSGTKGVYGERAVTPSHAHKVERTKHAESMQRPTAVFTTVPELRACTPEDVHDSMVRVVGRLLRYEAGDSLVWLGHYEPPYAELAVDCSLVQPFPFSQGALFQIIGEVDGSGRRCNGLLTVRALAHRCVEGLDMNVYRKALTVRNTRQ